MNKKATTAVQPKVECAEKSMNSVAADLEDHLEGLDVTSAGALPQCTHESQVLSGTHNVPTNANVPAHLLAHYNYQQNAINPDELRGMIAGMAAMAAQSNAVRCCPFHPISNSDCWNCLMDLRPVHCGVRCPVGSLRNLKLLN